MHLAVCTAGGDGFYKNGSSVHAAVLAVQHKACGQQEHAAEGSAHHCQPVCTGLGQKRQNGSMAAASGFASCTTFCAAAGTTAASAVVSAASVSAGAVSGTASCAGASGVTAGSAGGAPPAGWTGCPACWAYPGYCRPARPVSLGVTGVSFGQHYMLGLAALVNAADVVCIAVLIRRGLHDLCSPASSRAGPRPSAWWCQCWGSRPCTCGCGRPW